MLIAVKVVAIALAALLANYLLNQLSALRDFPGKTWLLVRLIGYLVVIAVAHEILGTQGVGDQLKEICRYVGLAAGVAIVYEGFGLWQQTRRLPAEEEDGLAAADLLKRLHDDVRLRVKDRLEYAVGEKAIDVTWESQNRAVGRDEARQVEEATLSWNRLLKFFSGGRGEVDVGENILQAFNHENISRKLLILGEPGSGKTTTLLKLAEALLAQFETTNQVPYIFELSAWRDDEQPILDWLTGQLQFDYGISLEVSRRWIKNNQLVPLLDGLDELEMKRQKKCVAKINDFATLTGQQVVVCCRSAEYAAGRMKLDKLNGALCLQPLTPKQIERYLRSLKRADIWNALNDQPELAALLHRAAYTQNDEKAETPFLQIPLFLQMLVVTYRDEQPISGKPNLFEAYIAHQLKLETRQRHRLCAKSKKEGSEWAYQKFEQEPSIELTKRYLAWLARQLNKNNIPNNFIIEQMQPSWLEPTVQKWKYWLIGNLLVFVLLGLPVFLAIGIAGSFAVGLVFGSLVSFASMTIGRISDKWERIKPVEIIQLPLSRESRQRLLVDIRWVLLLYPLLGLPLGLIFGFFLYEQLQSALSLVVCSILGNIFALIFVLALPLIEHMKEDLRIRNIPNEGIFSSAKNFLFSILFTSIAWLVIGVILEHSFEIESVSTLWSAIGIVVAPAFSFIVWGGLPAIQHLTLRFLLHRQSHIPHNYAQFLKYTTERRLTQQIGGRFRFIHRELLDHFDPIDRSTSEAP